MKRTTPLAVLPCFFIIAATANAQHCPTIVESYLSRTSIKHDAQDRALELELEYSKTGGQPKAKYQVYLLAYLEKNAHRVPAPRPAELVDKQLVRVLRTRTTERNDRGTYECRWSLNMNELAKTIIELGRFTDKDRDNLGGWGSLKENFRLAVFVPFLEDTTYSVLDGLPEDKHECNYTNERSLLFQPLPYSFSIHFGTVLGARLAEGDYYIQINQTPIEDRSDGPQADTKQPPGQNGNQ